MICNNPWCKVGFELTEIESNSDNHPKVCPKCRSFDNELSGGVSWVEKKYEGSRNDGLPHQVNFKINKFF
jgi:hypothetical protein